MSNLLTANQGSFEADTPANGWTGWAANATWDATEHRTGTHSCKLNTGEFDTYSIYYELFRNGGVDPEIGYKYKFSAWYKITGNDGHEDHTPGVMLRVDEFLLGSFYTSKESIYPNAHNTADWTYIECDYSPVVPIDGNTAGYNALQFYLVASKIAGSVYFDDVQIEKIKIFDARVLKPSAKKTIFAGDAEEVTIRVASPYGTTYASPNLKVDILITDITAIYRVADSIDPLPDAAYTDITIDLAGIGNGKFTVTSTLTELVTNSVIGTYVDHFYVDSSTAKPDNYFTETGKMVVGGSDFLPLVLYNTYGTDNEAADLAAIAATDFNVVVTGIDTYDYDNYVTTLNLFDAAGLKCIIPLSAFMSYHTFDPMIKADDTTISDPTLVKEYLVDTFKNYPALFGWWAADEVEQERLTDDVEPTYDYILENDKLHPSSFVSRIALNENENSRYGEVFSISAFPQYISKYAAPNYVNLAKHYSRARTNVYGNTPYWSLVEICPASSVPQADPRFRNILLGIYLSIVNNAKGFYFYNYHTGQGAKYWINAQALATHCKALKDVILAEPLTIQPTSSDSNYRVVTKYGSDTGKYYLVVSDTRPHNLYGHFGGADAPLVAGIHCTAHGLSANDPIKFYDSFTAAQAGVDIVDGTTKTYYVKSADQADSFTISESPGGDALAVTGSGTYCDFYKVTPATTNVTFTTTGLGINTAKRLYKNGVASLSNLAVNTDTFIDALAIGDTAVYELDTEIRATKLSTPVDAWVSDTTVEVLDGSIPYIEQQYKKQTINIVSSIAQPVAVQFYIMDGTNECLVKSIIIPSSACISLSSLNLFNSSTIRIKCTPAGTGSGVVCFNIYNYN